MTQALPEGVAIVKQRRMGASLCSVPWLPLLAGLGAIICTGVWHHFSSLALYDTKIIAALIGLPPPRAFASVLPGLMTASLVLVIVLVVGVWALYAWRALQQRRAAQDGGGKAAPTRAALRPFVAANAAVNVLQYVVTVWFVFMLALSMLWLGGGMVAAKATMDGANTLSVIDETLPRLISTAMDIDPAKQGYLVHVAGRDVNIGTSSCSLFCFTLARAMLADTIDCTCDDALAAQLMPPGNATADITDSLVCRATPVMCSINAYAFALYRQHMMPAVASIVVAVLLLLALLMLLSGTFGRATAEARRAAMSRCSSADADVRLGGGAGDDSESPRKGDA